MNDLINIVANYVSASFASTFIFGILTGWLIEWLFYNFIWKNSNKNNKIEDKAETNISSEIVEKTQKETKKAEERKEIDTNTSAETTKKSPLPFKDKENLQKTEVVDQKDKESDNLPSKQKAIKEEDVTTKEALIKQPVEDLEQKPVKKQDPKTKPTKPDDFTQLFGVGPSMSKHLKKIGLNSFKQLSALDTEALIEKLTAEGVRVINKNVMASWAEQAILADAGDFKRLKALQNKLKKG